METVSLVLGVAAFAAGLGFYVGYRIGHRDGWGAGFQYWWHRH